MNIYAGHLPAPSVGTWCVGRSHPTWVTALQCRREESALLEAIARRAGVEGDLVTLLSRAHGLEALLLCGRYLGSGSAGIVSKYPRIVPA
jgi:hypothetical protein